MRSEITIPSHGELLAGWHLTGAGDSFEGPGGRPCVVMAHGFGSNIDCGLLPYAERFAQLGLDVVAFDYRCFGNSSGEPRQLASWKRHREDYVAAIAFARGVDGVDPERIVLWGTSYSGGHVLAVAADDGRIAAIVSQTPAADGFVALKQSLRSSGLAAANKATLLGLRDLVSARRGRPAVTIPIIGAPGTVAAITSDDAEAGMGEISGPTWRNEVCARELLVIAQNRPGKRTKELRCPILFLLAEGDEVTPAGPIAKAAAAAPGRVELRRYPTGHFGMYVDPVLSQALADQVAFLTAVLAPAAVPAPATA